MRAGDLPSSRITVLEQIICLLGSLFKRMAWIPDDKSL